MLSGRRAGAAIAATLMAIGPPTTRSTNTVRPTATSKATQPIVYRRLVGASEVVAIVGLADGTVRYGERATGRVWDIPASATVDEKPKRRATLAVRTDGQRGLLGLALDRSGRTFASWVGSDGVLVVGQILPGSVRVVWKGPTTTDRANGGHIVTDSDGRHLRIGIGDLLAGGPKGRLLRIDPDGQPGQRPVLVSTGWNNPYAFDVSDDGTVWVADNSPGTQPERIGRGDATIFGNLSMKTAPSGAAVLGVGPLQQLATCGYVSHRLDVWDVDERGNAGPLGPPYVVLNQRSPLATDCLTAVALLPDRRLAYATAKGINISVDPIPDVIA